MSLKKDVTNLLKQKDYQGLARLDTGRNKLLSTLISLTYDKGTNTSWRAIEAIGILTGEISVSDPELVRNVANRLLWMIRDESGGIGWSSPEILGEIVRNNPELCADIAPVIVSFHEEPPLRAGVMRAVGRIGQKSPDMVAYAIPVVLSCLDNAEPAVRGNAAWALGEIGAVEAAHLLEKLKNDNSAFAFYEEGELRKITISNVAEQSLDKLGSKTIK